MCVTFSCQLDAVSEVGNIKKVRADGPEDLLLEYLQAILLTFIKIYLKYSVHDQSLKQVFESLDYLSQTAMTNNPFVKKWRFF